VVGIVGGLAIVREEIVKCIKKNKYEEYKEENRE
jgi:hypothetical protein